MFEHEVVKIDRTMKVVKGGKRLSFRCLVVIGNKRGQVGVGVGKGRDVATSIDNAKKDAYKQIVQVPITPSKSIPHPVVGHFGASKIMLRPSAPGSGLIAGSSIRTVLEFAGIKNILAKRLGSRNLLNNVRATLKILSNLKSN